MLENPKLPTDALLRWPLALVLLLAGASSAAAQLPNEQRKCVEVMNVDLTKVDRFATQQVSTCLRTNANGRPFNRDDATIDTVEECIADDPRGRIERATDKTDDDFARLCLTLASSPPFGATDAATVNAAGSEKATDLVHDVFGPNLDAPGLLATDAGDRQAASCQFGVWQAVATCQRTQLTEFVSCKRRGLRGQQSPGLIASAQDLSDLCLGIGAAGQPDPRGSIARKCSDRGIITILDGSRCAGEDLSALFPGCGTTDATATAACLDAKVSCWVCATVNRADGLARNCDLFDNGIADASCAAVSGTATPTTTPVGPTSTPPPPTATATMIPPATATPTPPPTATATATSTPPPMTSTATPTATPPPG